MEIKTEEIEKFCPRCERTLPLTKFYKAKRRNGVRAICRDCDRVLSSTRKDTLREKVYDKLGHVCNHCGFADKRALQIDHVFGGGNQEHDKIRSKDTFLKKVINDTGGLYQILCANCNWIKRFVRQEIAHPMPFTPEEREKILQSNFGKPIKDKTRQLLSEAGKGREAWNIGIPAWNRGIPRTEEEREKMSVAVTAAHATKTPEERSKLAQDRDANMTPEARVARAQKGADTLKKKREAEGWTPAVRQPKPLAEFKKAPDGSLVPHKWSDEKREAHRAVAAKREAAKTPEQKAAQQVKRLATMAANKAARQLPLAA